MAMLVFISVPFGLANLFALVEIKRLLEADSAEPAREAIFAAFERHRVGIFLQSAPWGLWFVPLGYLIIRSGFPPRLLGAGVILAGVGYVAHFVARLLVDGYRESPWPQMFAAPWVAEILAAVWLLAFSAQRTLWSRR